MFLITHPASFSLFFSYTCLVNLISPHWDASFHFLLVPIYGLCGCFLCIRVTYVISMCPALIFVVLFLFIRIGRSLCSGFFLCVYVCLTPLLVPLTSVVRVAAATVRLHIFVWSGLTCSSCCLSCVVKFLFAFISSVNAASCSSVTGA